MSLWRKKELQELARVFLLLETEDEARAFLRDILTETELLELSKRWKAARMLDEGVPYTTIVRETGLSSTTVARISKWMQEGEGGYRLLLDRI
ncbi:MAG: helix-turn-helix domain-containing protein [Bdellovibrionales bacterium]|nr:helix-turn-helix domain-containing protein [Bdellovibrionales bacterium]